MGCDIHCHAEVKINNKWEHLKEVEIHRNYELFAYMVTGHGRAIHIHGLTRQRGLPPNVNGLTEYLLRSPDYHTRSWLTGAELKKVKHSEYYEGFEFLEDKEFKYDFDPSEIFGDNFRLVFAFDN